MEKTYVTYSQHLVDQAKQGRRWTIYRVENGRRTQYVVPASIIERFVEDIPLNHCEAQFFQFIRHNEALFDLVVERTKGLMQKYPTYSIHHTVHWLRVEADIAITSTSDYRINDHVSPYLGRMMNEYFGIGYFKVKHATNEPKVDDDGDVLVVDA